MRLTRVQGALKGILSTKDVDDASLVAKAKASPGLVGHDLAREVMPDSSSMWDCGLHRFETGEGAQPDAGRTSWPSILA